MPYICRTKRTSGAWLKPKSLKRLALPGDSNPCFRRERARSERPPADAFALLGVGWEPADDPAPPQELVDAAE